MTEPGARAWLPKEAFSLEAVGACLSGPVAAWAERWFVRAPAAIAAVRADVPDAAHASHPGLVIEGANAVLELNGHGKRRLLEAALDVDLSAQVLSEADRRLLDEFARRVVRDLAVLVEESLAADSGGGDLTIVSTLAIAGHEALSVSIGDGALAPAIKAAMAGTGAPKPALARRSEAIKRTTLTVRGHLGRAELAFDELENLNVGDVLILDRNLAEPVELKLPGIDVPLARGRLSQSDGALSIQL